MGKRDRGKKRPVKCDTKYKNLDLREVNSNLELWEPVWDTPQRSASWVDGSSPNSLHEDCQGRAVFSPHNL